MTVSLSSEPASATPTVRGAVARRFFKNPLGLTSFTVLCLIVIISVFGRLLAPHDPGVPRLDQINAAPNAVYLLGGDGSGRDILSRLLVASQLTLIGAVTVGVVAILVGLSTGLLAGYFGRGFDATFSWFSNALLAVPSIIILVALYTAIGPNTVVTMAVFGVLISPFLFRLMRNIVISVKGELYVDAARVSGVSSARIMSRHILAAVRGIVVIAAVGMIGAGIMIQAGLEFLGLGSPSEPTWGGMLNDAFLNIFRSPWGILWPGLAIGITTAALGLIANALRDALEDADAAVAPRTAVPNGGNSDDSVEGPRITIDPHASHVLSVRDLSISYGLPGGGQKNVVRGVDLNVDRGEILGIVGESGSGKTQTVFAVLGLLPDAARITRGQIVMGVRADTKAVTASAVRGTHIGYVPQEPMSNLDPSFTLGSQLVEPLTRRMGMSRRAATAHTLELFRRVGLSDPQRTFRSYPHEISGGMAQRILIAGAIASDPELLIADEPTSSLDVTVQADILELLRDLQSERGMGMILVTHSLGVVADICNRVAVMKSGEIVETATVEELFRNPQQEYTRTLLGSTLDDKPGRSTYLETAR
ncbi:dipeptide/oligopeptide/nickel ABC transporter permease/ATP-binding protein [Microbacterium rhizomatis]|uniref:Dipeptide/oligopeptide/nickel ABC transporter permease/ATP-binding protein n=1 Tax=Microbacterium rhizomatis TaxID=1631477 RepID=A0A5J5IX99_9MICO|nr:dipeptide/oligopeptide/nickel ABC transporter permease/ATP-binding protein [Microbacterium rhizomatis]KAA9105875.1 dipeptide/oligopeptide/nickel ABC transporter permease/ATP-binding protein [Microbacterium rhizomatis]